MNQKIRTLKRTELLSLGFALLMPGIFLAAVAKGNRYVEVFGILMLLLASAAFGASIRATDRQEK